MTGESALNLIMARLGNRTNTTLRANALLEMQLAQREYFTRLGFTPWFLRVDYSDAAFITVADQEYVSVPDGYLMIDPEWGTLFYQDPDDTNADTWTEIEQGQYRDFKADYKEEETGKPQVFDILDNKIYLRYIPDAAYALRFQHYNSDTAIADDSNTNLWLTNAASWIIGETGFIVASLHVKDSEAATFFDNMRNSAKGELYRTHVARESNAADYRMGERP